MHEPHHVSDGTTTTHGWWYESGSMLEWYDGSKMPSMVDGGAGVTLSKNVERGVTVSIGIVRCVHFVALLSAKYRD